jgi:hypothetical protein
VDLFPRGLGLSCEFSFVNGTRYIVFARQQPDGRLTSFFCDPTALLGRAGEALALARGIASGASRTGRLTGRVQIDRGAREPSPVRGLSLTLRGTQGVHPAVTDANGGYEFVAVLPGRYTLSVSDSPEIEAIRPATVEIRGPGDCVQRFIAAAKKRRRRRASSAAPGPRASAASRP